MIGRGFDEGTRVEVYDPDHDEWLHGVIEDIAVHIAGHQFVIVATDNATAYDLPLKIAVPDNRVDEWLRVEP